ncbi:cysteine methyltransferase [Burkholderia pyrrocinia]|uniref:methylated-DNA--[protein]-cysteine S-methyltransferase n=1 Tax=Burkholderia pyrrocinia TaxID=60550 RepID=A0A2Z5N1G8_BURPY|nr:methylated-DNA--[protein]-cysteine S-methyltransferase [Burkholderia pyrrocinia]AXF22774.1 cysteine methyltransferase [Burkholderia pyrrocinia]
MKTHSISRFKYNFRAPGLQVEGPIQYAFGRTDRDTVLVGKSHHGICAIFLGENEQHLLSQLETAFPTIELNSAQHAMVRELTQVIAFIENDAADGVVPLDIGGTLFQQRVWQALCEIPAGETRSYSDVAKQLGVPDAVRAVAGACAANVLAIAIPCHRVVRQDGSISGYRWGVERKRDLLAEECAR